MPMWGSRFSLATRAYRTLIARLSRALAWDRSGIRKRDAQGDIQLVERKRPRLLRRDQRL